MYTYSLDQDQLSLCVWARPSIYLPVSFQSTPTHSEDMYAQDSIDMLTQAGIQFKRHEDEGIELADFAELLTSSGLVLREEISWITFARFVDVLKMKPLPP